MFICSYQVFSYDPVARETVSLMKFDYLPSGFDVYFSSISPSDTPYVLLADQDSLSEAEITNPSWSVDVCIFGSFILIIVMIL